MRLRPPSSSLSPSILPHRVVAFDRRVGRAVNEAVTSAGADRVLLAVSTSANHGLLWFAAAGALALTGPEGRRAAVRGLLSLGGASAFANLVAKPIFGGPRPHAGDVPLRRQLRNFPASASFPSGHTASAVAFATGVALESPRGALIVAPFAAAVAYSRLHVGAHWVSDVAGGALIGAGIAVAGRMLVPAPPRTPTDLPAGPFAELPVLRGGDGLFLLIAERSGERLRDRTARRVLGDTLRGLPFARVHLLEPGQDAGAVLQEAASSGQFRALGVDEASGVTGAAAVASAAGLPLFVVPTGRGGLSASTRMGAVPPCRLLRGAGLTAPGSFQALTGTSTAPSALGTLEAGTGVTVELERLPVTARAERPGANAGTVTGTLDLYASWG